MVKIAILGYGVVGSGVYEVIRTNEQGIHKKAERLIDIKYILDLRDFPDHPESHLFVKDFEQILADDEVQVVVEVIGGIKPAYDFTKRSLQAGKHVVTSNKELVATHGVELLKLAAEKQVNYLFEASVGGGIPVIKPLAQCLAANEVTGIAGILNGTTNYILTSMIKGGQTFEVALKDAQEKGYAEKNPEADVEGHDACRKIAILTSLALGYHIPYKDIPTEGITQITLEDVRYAEAMGMSIKLIGMSKIVGEKVMARVAPMLVSKDSPLANVEDVFNAILIQGNAVGDVMFYGRGAGKLPTASAVVADVIDCAKHLGVNNRFLWEESREGSMLPAGEVEAKTFIRMKARDKKAAMAAASEYFGVCTFVSAEDHTLSDELALVTGTMKQKDFDIALQRLTEYGEVVGKLVLF